MANTYKNIVITPNIGNTADPRIQFSGGNTSANTDINLYVYPTSNGTLSFEGSAGQLFSITNDLSGTLFSVNDVSGIPSIEVNADGTVSLAPFGGNVVIGNTAELVVSSGAGIYANGSLGTAGQVLHSNGTSVYWAADDNAGGTVTSVATGNGLTGGTITTTGTLSAVAGTGTVVNATGIHVNATYIGTLTANNTTYVNSKTEGNLNVNNALTANKWTTARTLSLTGDVTGSVSWDGSANASITATIAADSVALGTDTTGNYMVNVSAGGGISVSHTQGEGSTATVSHADTSSQASVDNTNGSVIQDVTLDTYGHVTALASVDLDGRYYTETEADSRFVNVTGDTMTGVLTISNTNDYQLQLQSSDTWVGILFNDGGAVNEYIYYNGTHGTFSIGGGGSNVAGKKLHVDGGLSVGSSSDATATPTNGIYSEGQVEAASFKTSNWTIDQDVNGDLTFTYA